MSKLDFSKIKPPKTETAPVDPIELFQKLKVTDQNINDLWLAQGDALRDWHKNRTEPDVGIVLNTGAGKTLVGLLIAQSLVNETKGKVLYACSSIQLVEQTAEKASGYGLDVTTYFRSNYSNDSFLRCVAPCVTTYQALFNGRSIFFREDIAAVVFDDAHAAEHLLRDHFSVRIKRSTLEDLYTHVLSLFEDYFRHIGKASSFQEIKEEQNDRVLFVPPFEVRDQHAELVRLLLTAGLQDSPNTKFSWAHIKDHVDQCCVLITAADVTITPPFVPVLTLPYFSKADRRIYLSATLSAPDAFARTFGRVPSKVVAPKTTAGECERLIAMPSRLDDTPDSVEVAKAVIQNRKALVLVPTYARAERWQGLAEPPPPQQVAEHVAAFKGSLATPKLLLAARYDGVDLPGDTCRLMVIDDLPMGVGPLERYMWESLGMNNSLRTAIASRIAQSFGRISRGMSDHGVVLLTGKRLLDWLLVPNNAAILPAFLQKQILLGYEISNQLEDVDDLARAIDACLARDESWLSAYEAFMQSASAQGALQDIDSLRVTAESEARYAKRLWRRDYHGAANAIAATLDIAYSLSSSTGAWHSLWLGYAQEMLGDQESARELYSRAHANQTNIPPSRRIYSVGENWKASPQVFEIESQIKISADGTVSLPKTLGADLQHLSGGGSAGQTEESLRCLGKYLGLVATRPDKEYGTGPDVLWFLEGGPALCIDAKTNKEANSRYTKKEIGQMADHVQWVRDHTDANEVVPLFVGPVSRPSDNANPPEEFLVAPLEKFDDLGKRLVAALNDATSNALPITLRTRLNDVIDNRKLKYPDLLDLLEFRALRDL